MAPTIGALVFEGGHPEAPGRGEAREGNLPPDASPLALLGATRRWTTLDTLEKLLGRPEVDVVVLATDSPGLAAEAAALGARVHLTGAGFHFGRTLAALVGEYRLDRVVYLGGGAAPLLGPPELDFLLGTLVPGGRVFVANNAQSPDLVGLGSVDAIPALSEVATDNETLFTLVEAGYRPELLPDTAAASFDLDTPSDVLFLAREARRRDGRGHAGLGPRARAGLAALNIDFSVLERAAEVLARPDYPSVTLIGRVSGRTVAYLNDCLLLRLRVFSEERGMKALGRVARGEVRSLLGAVAATLGFEYLVREIAALSDVVFWDTRVILTHLAGWPEDADRFEADLGRWDRVRDPALRALGRAATGVATPFVLGGHSVVAGGLRLLVEGIVAERNGWKLA